MRILDQYGRQNNICNTPEIASIELHHNKYGTGEYFLTFITHCDLPGDGFWTDGLITPDEAETILTIMKRSKDRLRKIRVGDDNEQD